MPKKTVFIAVLLFILDALVFNQGFIAIVLLFIVAPFRVLKAFLRRRKNKDRAEFTTRVRAAAVYAATAAAILLFNYASNEIARGRAQSVIAACEAYKGKYGSYPQTLSDTVPEFMESVPSAKFTVMSGNFTYIAMDEKPILVLTVIPPFGREVYSFEKKGWSYLD